MSSKITRPDQTSYVTLPRPSEGSFMVINNGTDEVILTNQGCVIRPGETVASGYFITTPPPWNPTKPQGDHGGTG